MGLDTTIQLKAIDEPSTPMERLMMEQDVLKSFLSGNPLDGFYLHIKKGSFLNQVKEEEIQRAKKKGFFIKIEDISGDWEFFTKDVLNFQKFDLIILYGSKSNGRVYIDKLVKTSYEKLKKLAGGRFDPERTVVRAKKERYGDIKKQELERIKAEIQNPVVEKKQDIEISSDDFEENPAELLDEVLPSDYEEEIIENEDSFSQEDEIIIEEDENSEFESDASSEQEVLDDQE